MGTNYYAPNSGYRGYSESVRAYEAKQEGKFPKTTFKRHYGISEKKFIELENRGVIYNSEWHHTSKFFNKTKFYAIENIILFYILIGKKQKAYELYKEKQKEIERILRKPTPHRTSGNAKKFKFEAGMYFFTNKIRIKVGEIVQYKGVNLECYHLTKTKKIAQFTFVNKKHTF